MSEKVKTRGDASRTALAVQDVAEIDRSSPRISEPANAKLSREAKADAIRNLLEQGASQAEVAATLQIDRTTVYRICQRPHTVKRSRRMERGRQRLNNRQLRMLRYSIHDRVPADAFWTLGARRQLSRDDRLAFRAGRWTTGLIRALVVDRYPDTHETSVGDDALREFIRTKLGMQLAGDKWLQVTL